MPPTCSRPGVNSNPGTQSRQRMSGNGCSGGIARVRDVLGLLEAGDTYLATLLEPNIGPTMGEVMSWPEVIEAAQRAALARGYKPPGEARASHLRVVSS